MVRADNDVFLNKLEIFSLFLCIIYGPAAVAISQLDANLNVTGFYSEISNQSLQSGTGPTLAILQ